jgi:hypothetical protein
MRRFLLTSALLLSTAAAAFPQQPAGPSLVTGSAPGSIGQSLSPFTQQPRDFSKLPPGWRMSTDLPRTFTVLEPGPVPSRTLHDAHIDPGIVVHPPQASVGGQPPGTLIAQNEFPGLRLQPIEGPSFKLEPIPTTWPAFRLEPIPTLCVQCKMLRVESRPQAQEPPTR